MFYNIVPGLLKEHRLENIYFLIYLLITFVWLRLDSRSKNMDSNPMTSDDIAFWYPTWHVGLMSKVDAG